MYYNFVCIHETLCIKVSGIMALWEAVEPKASKRGPYNKRISLLQRFRLG